MSTQIHDYEEFPNIGRRNLTQELIEIPLVVGLMKIPPGIRILEVGCGRGVALPPLARLCKPNALVGIDINQGFIAEAKQRISTDRFAATVRTADVRSLPFEDECFDLVIDFGTCYHIANAATALKEISRVLVPGGRFVHETRLGQLLSHPIRSAGLTIPWHRAPDLTAGFHRMLWGSRTKS